MKKAFTKPPRTYGEQIGLLQSRGMIFEDYQTAEFYLSHLNYYRLGAYWLPFEADHGTHRFEPGTTFSNVLNLYFFDRELRLFLLDAIERIEVSVRTKWAYTLAHRHGTHSYTDASLCLSRQWYEKNLQKLQSEISRSEETFAHHFAENYTEQFPPIWAACELISLGLLSQLYRNLKPMRTRTDISQCYGLDENVLQSWLHHLSIVRNISAHHGRIWNREFTVTAKRPRRPIKTATAFVDRSRKLYNTLVLVLHFMDAVSPNHQFRQRFRSLVRKHSIALANMGFPNNWAHLEIWQG